MNNKKVFSWSISVALAGFLFGFDTIVISGANLPIKDLWNTSPIFHGVFIMSMALWGTVLGSVFGSIPCDKIGRKNTLIWIGILFFVSYTKGGFSNRFLRVLKESFGKRSKFTGHGRSQQFQVY